MKSQYRNDRGFGKTSFMLVSNTFDSICSISVKEKEQDNLVFHFSEKLGSADCPMRKNHSVLSHTVFMESLILAQDERWRHA